MGILPTEQNQHNYDVEKATSCPLKNSQKWIGDRDYQNAQDACFQNLHNQYNELEINSSDSASFRKINSSSPSKISWKETENYKIFKIELRKNNKERRRQKKLKGKLNELWLDALTEIVPQFKPPIVSLANSSVSASIIAKVRDPNNETHDSKYNKTKEDFEMKNNDYPFKYFNKNQPYLDSKPCFRDDVSEGLKWSLPSKDDFEHLKLLNQPLNDYLSLGDIENPFEEDPVSPTSSPLFRLNLHDLKSKNLFKLD